MGGSDDDGDLCPEGDKLRAEADKRLKSLNLFGAASKRLMDAAELYGRAANKYRVARLCTRGNGAGAGRRRKPDRGSYREEGRGDAYGCCQ